MLFHEELFTRSQCTYCQQEISSIGIECVECHNGNFKLCVECFQLGAEIGQHKSDHKYRFFDSGSLVLTLNPNPDPSNRAENSGPSQNQQELGPTSTPGTSTSTTTTTTTDNGPAPKWSAREEIRLLDAIEQYGFGNWQDISKHIESKTPQEAKAHYVERYVEGPLGQLTWSTGVPNEANHNICNNQIQKPVDHTVPADEGPLSPSLTQRFPPLEISPEEMLQLGYMPNRDDYEKEFDNDAEKLVSQLSFTSDDDELEIGMKLALVDMYTRRLRERARRKRMIRDYQLVSKFVKKDKAKNNGGTSGEISGHKGQLAAYEKMLQDKFRPFAQFQNSKEQENLIRNLVKEKELKFRLQELYKYRRAGIRRPEECAEYERLKGNTTAVKGKRSLETIPEDNEEGRSGNKKGTLLAENLVAPLLVRQLQQAIPQNSPKPTTAMNSVGSDENVGASPSAAQNLIQPLFSSEDSSLKSCTVSNESGRVLLPLDLLDEPKVVGTQQPPINENSFLLKEKLRASADLYTAEYAPSSDLLTGKELQFCLKTTITPAQFLTIKTALLLARKPKIDNQQGMELKDIPCPPNITSIEWEQVITFFKSNYM